MIGLDLAPGADTDVIGTVADRALVDRLFGERAIDAVIHGGGLHKPDIVRHPKQAFVDVNVSGTLALLEAAGGDAVPELRLHLDDVADDLDRDPRRGGRPGGVDRRGPWRLSPPATFTALPS